MQSAPPALLNPCFSHLLLCRQVADRGAAVARAGSRRVASSTLLYCTVVFRLDAWIILNSCKLWRGRERERAWPKPHRQASDVNRHEACSFQRLYELCTVLEVEYRGADFRCCFDGLKIT